MQYRNAQRKRTAKTLKQHEERKLSYQIAEFLSIQYPKVIFRFDVAADIPMTIVQGSIIKNKLLHKKGYPDLFIAEPKGKFHGLYIELKKSYSEVFKKDGSYKKSEHIETQAAMHKQLRAKGYCVEWGLGFEDTVEKIRAYMSIGQPKEDERQTHLEDFIND